MIPAKQFADLPDNLSLLTEVVGEGAPDDFPTLTEIVAEPQVETSRAAGVPEADIHQPCAISGEEMQKLLRQLETHLETALTQKLGLHIEQLQRQAIEQAVGELKAALPELLRNALSTHSR